MQLLKVAAETNKINSFSVTTKYSGDNAYQNLGRHGQTITPNIHLSGYYKLGLANSLHQSS
jgi:hypothetical protein